jgi:hypothetical protein
MQIAIQTLRYITLKKAAMNRIAMAERDKLCCACLQPLGDSRVIRGCHERCVKATKRAVAAGKFTEDERIAQGKILSASSGGRKPSNPVSIEAMGA